MEKIDAKFSLPWVTINLLRLVNDNKTSLDRCEIKVEHYIKLLELIKSGRITELKGKEILRTLTDEGLEKFSDLEGLFEDGQEYEEFETAQAASEKKHPSSIKKKK